MNDNLRAVNSRMENGTERDGTRRRWALWILLLVILIGGVVLSFRSGPRVTPLIETVR